MLDLVSSANGYPITLEELKAHLAIDVDDEDTRLEALLATATSVCEAYTQRSFISQTWKLTLPSFDKKIWIPKPPTASVTSVKYYDSSNVQQTLSSSAYYLCRSERNQAWIEPVDVFPTTYNRPDAVEIVFVSGSFNPNQVKHAIKLIAAELNENREGNKGGISNTARLLLDQLWWGI